jgi:glycosyltransferase involved in cell wall biosynthesis
MTVAPDLAAQDRSAGALRGLAVAYVVQLYPKVSHTFIQREILALRALGAAVDTYTLHRPEPEEVRTASDRREAERTVSLRPVSAPRLVRTHVAAVVAAPAAYLATLRDAVAAAPGGIRARVWQVFYFAQAVLLHEALRRRAPRHVHAHLANVATDVTWLATTLGNRSGTGPWTWSFTMHGPTEFRAVQRFNLAHKVRAADLVVCISDYCRSQLMSVSPPSEWHKLVVVHCGVDVERYRFRDRADGTPRRILSVGRMVPEKGQSLFLDVVAELRARGHDLQAVLVGDGPDRDLLVARRDALGLGEVVELPGALGQDDLVEVFDAADLFALPSFDEGVPVVLMEAMASGLPVVATTIAGIPELIDDGVSGRLVAAGRVDAMVAALEELLIDRGLRERLAGEARRRVEERFSAATEARRLGRLLAEAGLGA